MTQNPSSTDRSVARNRTAPMGGVAARNDQKELLTPQDLSRLLGIPVRTLADWRSARKGPLPLRIGVHVRYRLSDVEAWLEARAHAAQDWMAS